MKKTKKMKKLPSTLDELAALCVAPSKNKGMKKWRLRGEKKLDS